MKKPVIEISALSFSYNGAPVFENVDLSLGEGAFTAIIGPNGGGKTTLLKLILGLLKPDRGRVRVFGKPPGKTPVRAGYVPQDTAANRSVPMTVSGVALMGRLRGGFGRVRFSAKDRAAARESLEKVGMWDRRDVPFPELSGGQRQRVLEARAICSGPELLLLDEPTASMDQGMQTEFYTLLKELNKTATILVASHELVVLSSYIKSVACVSGGIHFHDAPGFTRQMLETTYACPVELIAHGLPHRVLEPHGKD